MSRSLATLEQLIFAAVNSIAASSLIHFRLRTIIYKAVGIHIHLRTRVSSGVIVRTSRLSIGRRSTVNYNCLFDNRAHVTIGENVGVGPGVQFITSSHEYGSPTTRAGRTSLRPIVVENGVWIGAGCIILPGVTIGNGAVIAAGAVVGRDCNPHTLYAGAPAKAIRELPA